MSPTTQSSESIGRGRAPAANFIEAFHGVRYQSRDVERAVEFYTKQLGFALRHEHMPAFATVAIGDLEIHRSGPDASGSRPLPGGRKQEPGGSTRVVLRVSNLASAIETLKNAGVKFRNELESGPAGRQIQVEDPDGNP